MRKLYHLSFCRKCEHYAGETSIKEIGLMRDWFVDRIVKPDMKMKGVMDNKA